MNGGGQWVEMWGRLKFKPVLGRDLGCDGRAGLDPVSGQVGARMQRERTKAGPSASLTPPAWGPKLLRSE